MSLDGMSFRHASLRAWKHQLALTILASWFVAETRLDWLRHFEQSPELMVQYPELDALPNYRLPMSVNLFVSSLPLPQL